MSTKQVKFSSDSRKSTMRITEKETFRVLIGTRNILNTEWPIESFVTRCQEGKKIFWIATYSLCNGVPSGSRRFSSQRAAIDSL